MYSFKRVCQCLRTRMFSTTRGTNILEDLTNRKLIRVSGNEVGDFLQGLITNDINHLDHGIGSMYAMFLNTKGRVLYDTLIYKTQELNTYLLECDVDALNPLVKHLKMHKVRRKIDIVSLENDFKVFALFNPINIDCGLIKIPNNNIDGIIVPCNVLNEKQPANSSGTMVLDDLTIYKDPRVVALGSRIIAPVNTDVNKKVNDITNIENNPNPEQNYRWLRYNLGVGEGVIDLPPNNCFPLEANCDYLHGVSFHKGCYIGQELTARTHHTGVVRKRLLPLYFKDKLTSAAKLDTSIVHENVNLGKIRGIEGNVGLALFRIAQAIEFKHIKIQDTIATTGKPNWWPMEAPKDKISV